MEVQDNFVKLSALICEPARAKMLWSMLDGKAYTASELSTVADISATSASNHLSKLLEADLVKVESQGRHRYFSFSRPEVAYAVESLANLATGGLTYKTIISQAENGIKYCRTCYDHIAGFVGVSIVQALENQKLIARSEKEFIITTKGWKWLENFGIRENMFVNNRRPIARQCLDWTERTPHLAGQLGALLLERMFEKKWFKRARFSRELLVTSKGSQEIYELLKIEA
jgi:DNA-binding transcriptional ArsR family regulator